MTHTGHDHPNTKAARAACRKAHAAQATQPATTPAELLNIVEGAYEPRPIGQLVPGDLFVHPIHTTEVYKVVGSEFGYTKYCDQDADLPTGLNGFFTELPNSTVVTPA